MRHEVWVLAALGALLATGSASADVKNQSGSVCERLSTSEAPESAVYTNFTGQTCNNSDYRLRLICPVVQDLGDGAGVTFTFDYEMWNPNGANGNTSEPLECAAFSRTRYAQGFYWSGWKDANSVGGWGATPVAMTATVNAMADNSFIHGVCYLPRKYDGNMSCISHIRYNEQ